ncbi:MAG TPA: hypothetical protein VFT64_04580 [Rickettsiales bacterium]|nr:hypothetical protein [Rickettsiales bacterium]
MMYKQEISGTFETVIGIGGASKEDFESALDQTKAAVELLRGHHKGFTWPVLTVPERIDDLEAIEATAKHIRENFDTMVILGMGASSHSGSSLAALARNPYSGHTGSMKMHFVDNVDPHSFLQLLNSITLKTTIFVAISKSGDTAETIAQLLILLRLVKAKLGGYSIKKHFLFITEPRENPLRHFGNEFNIAMLDQDPDIEGRFAVFTAAGLLPARVAGLDIHAIRHSAADVVQHTLMDKTPEPAIGAALHHALRRKGKTVSVMMPYSDRLDAFTTWHQQLWSGSLGKDGQGTTALRALGACDQYSQLQLYLEGPRDKFVTMIAPNNKHSGTAIPFSRLPSIDYLNGHTLGDLMAAEQLATTQTLVSNHCPLRIFAVNKLDEAALGALMMHFMLETIITAQLWNVDAFDQPALGTGRQLMKKYLSHFSLLHKEVAA